MGRIDVIVLASGLARRMGCNKLLLPLGGCSVIGQFLSMLPYALFQKVIVVYAQKEVGAIAGEYPVLLCRNQRPEAGKSHSIQLGVALSRAEDGIMFAVADQPLLTSSTVTRLVEVFCRRNCRKIVVPTVEGRPANPVIFPAACRSEFAALQGEAGGRQLIDRQPERVCYVPFVSGEEFGDLDTPEEYQQVAAKWPFVKGDPTR